MSNIVDFMRRRDESATNTPELPETAPPGVEFYKGKVLNATITSATGTRPLFELIGKERYFVDVVELDDEGEPYRWTFWDGDTYSEAVRQAKRAQTDWDAPEIRELTDTGGDAA